MKRIERIYKENKDYIYNYLYGLTRDKDVAEDLLSEVFLKVILKYKFFNKLSSERTWIYSIARYTFYEYIRKKNKNNDLSVLLENNMVNLFEIRNIEEKLVEKELIDKIKSAINNLNEKEKDVCNLRIKGYSYTEISKELNITENSSRVLFFRGKEKIRKILKEELDG